MSTIYVKPLLNTLQVTRHLHVKAHVRPVVHDAIHGLRHHYLLDPAFQPQWPLGHTYCECYCLRPLHCSPLLLKCSPSPTTPSAIHMSPTQRSLLKCHLCSNTFSEHRTKDATHPQPTSSFSSTSFSLRSTQAHPAHHCVCLPGLLPISLLERKSHEGRNLYSVCCFIPSVQNRAWHMEVLSKDLFT